MKEGQRSLVSKAWGVLRERPQHFVSSARCYLLFCWARLQRRILPSCTAGVEFSENVRLQRNSSVMAERPDAGIRIGAHSIIYEDARLEAYGSGGIEIGEYSVLGAVRIVSRCSVVIGRRFLSSWNVFIQDYDSHPVDPAVRAVQVQNLAADFRPRFDRIVPERREGLGDWDFPGEAIVIGDDVWVGANSTILKGAQIGSGSIVAAGSVVLRGSYPDRAVLAGNPAKVVKCMDGGE